MNQHGTLLDQVVLQTNSIKRKTDDKKLGDLFVSKAFDNYLHQRLSHLKHFNISYPEKIHQINYEWNSKLSVEQKSKYLS
tara:strand:- start:1282 stop:1521 length:240 start_codon:yes stop_codon:yes gene_type:complete